MKLGIFFLKNSRAKIFVRWLHSLIYLSLGDEMTKYICTWVAWFNIYLSRLMRRRLASYMAYFKARATPSLWHELKVHQKGGEAKKTRQRWWRGSKDSG